jgi:cobalt-zinc-cadmium resistance protein CzcA
LSNRYSGLVAGNWRSGLVVASVIPLCLFAISLMNIFGIDANLMSLGAIDSVLLLMEPSLLLSSLRFK